MSIHQISIELGSCKIDNKVGVDPDTLEIKKGDKVKWINNDTAFHTITSTTDKKIIDGIFDSKIVEAAGDFSFKFNDVGDFRYFDIIHPWIVGKISVK